MRLDFEAIFVLENIIYLTNMPNQAKVDQVADITAKFEQAKSSALIQYQGLNAADIATLRDNVRANGGRIEVVKNSLITRALANLGISLPETFWK